MRGDAESLLDPFRSTPGEFLRYVRSLCEKAPRRATAYPPPEFTRAEWAALMQRTPFRRGGGWPKREQ